MNVNHVHLESQLPKRRFIVARVVEVAIQIPVRSDRPPAAPLGNRQWVSEWPSGISRGVRRTGALMPDCSRAMLFVLRYDLRMCSALVSPQEQDLLRAVSAVGRSSKGWTRANGHTMVDDYWCLRRSRGHIR